MTLDEFRKWWESATPRERNAKVAELVMGWERADGVWSGCNTHCARFYHEWRPTTDIAAAAELVGALPDYVWEIKQRPGSSWVVYIARLIGNTVCPPVQAVAATEPEARSLAACLAKIAEGES
jgi:hypothetical protein